MFVEPFESALRGYLFFAIKKNLLYACVCVCIWFPSVPNSSLRPCSGKHQTKGPCLILLSSPVSWSFSTCVSVSLTTT